MIILNLAHIRGVPGEVEWHKEPHIQAWQKLQYGMFIHWGLYSLLGGEWNGKPVTKGYSEQIQMWANIPDNEYQALTKEFVANHYDPDEICQLAKDAGMKYIVITTKHHDGFSLFDTKTTDYNTVKMTPFAKDAIKMLAEACERHGLKFGMYYSLVDWYQGHKFDPQNNNVICEDIEKIIEGQLRELLSDYGPIAEVWFDMSNPTIKQSEKFINIVRELQPRAAVNGRIWNNLGDFRTLDDNQIPEVRLENAWQTPASIYQETWGYRNWQERDDFDGKIRSIAKALVSVIARGGNYLLNIGPKGDGSIVPFEKEVLKEVGNWLDRYPKAVLGAKPTLLSEQDWGITTFRDQDLFLHVIDWPEDGEIVLPGLVTNVESVMVDETTKTLTWQKNNHTLTVELPKEPFDDVISVIRVRLSDDLYVVPEKVVEIQGGSWEITKDYLYTGYGYADNGHYFSLYRSKVRKSAYLLNNKDGEVSFVIRGRVNPNKKYKVTFQDQTKIIKGKHLVDRKVGSFKVSAADALLELHITVHEPSHDNEDLELDIRSIQVK